MENLKLLFGIYYKPTDAMSDIMDHGNWWFAAVGVLVVSIGLQIFINTPITDTYAVSQFESANSIGDTYSSREVLETDSGFTYVVGKRLVPFIGFNIFSLFTLQSFFVAPLVVLSLFYLPVTILIAALVGRLGNPGVVVRRDYATFASCSLMGWIAAHLPFAVVGAVLLFLKADASLFWIPWILSGALFLIYVLFALRTVFGLEYSTALITVSTSWIGFCFGVIIFQAIGPWILSPFLLIIAVFYFGGFLRGEISGLGNSMRQKRDFKRHLHNATVNPNDADAHVQLGLIYSARRQTEKAREHFLRAYEIDNDEIDANYELGKMARIDGDLQKAIEHFSVVVEQSDRYSLSEIWREIGITYKEAGMLDEAETALEKFVTRRSFDSEGLYHFGMLLKAKGEQERATEQFEQAIEAVRTAPYYRKKEMASWAKLASKEVGR